MGSLAAPKGPWWAPPKAIEPVPLKDLRGSQAAARPVGPSWGPMREPDPGDGRGAKKPLICQVSLARGRLATLPPTE
jgi:hypothetical protein